MKICLITLPADSSFADISTDITRSHYDIYRNVASLSFLFVESTRNDLVSQLNDMGLELFPKNCELNIMLPSR